MTESASIPSTQDVSNLNNETFVTQSTILIVDDNPQNVELLQAFLESMRSRRWRSIIRI
jgi:PleD family two-component response regulator